jgi:CRP-like cAMP-binding protein
MDVQILKNVELFRGLDEEQLRQIADISEEQVYQDKAVIFNYGSDGDALYIISAGQVAIQTPESSGAGEAAVYLGEGQIVGEMAIIDQGKRSASVAAVGETVLYRITSTDFTDLCSSNTGIGYVIMRNLAQDMSFKLRHRGS